MKNNKFDKSALENYLDERINKRLYKKDQVELAKMIYLTDAGHKLQKGYKLINEYFNDNNLLYTINGIYFDKRSTLSDGSVNPNYRKGYWLMAKYTVN
ncbi:hypothetical protein [Paenibacillus xylanexedens]|uniref:hypothetical protein n=1 Tax=Paenibacillus xylanexedens TaxID=528191 RepID=UPI000F526AAD|nr:hypothetical protein [Paenibacillus xylanexedens]